MYWKLYKSTLLYTISKSYLHEYLWEFSPSCLRPKKSNEQYFHFLLNKTRIENKLYNFIKLLYSKLALKYRISGNNNAHLYTLLLHPTALFWVVV